MESMDRGGLFHKWAPFTIHQRQEVRQSPHCQCPSWPLTNPSSSLSSKHNSDCMSGPPLPSPVVGLRVPSRVGLGSKLRWVHCIQLLVRIPRLFQSAEYPGLQSWFIHTGCEARWLLCLGTYLQSSACASILCLTSAAALGVIRLFLSGLCRACHPALVFSCIFDPQGSWPSFVPSFHRPVSSRGEHRSPSSPFLLFVCLFPSGLLGGLSLSHVVAHVKKPSPIAWLRFSGSRLANSSCEMYHPEFISVWSLSTCIPSLTSHLTLSS